LVWAAPYSAKANDFDQLITRKINYLEQVLTKFSYQNIFDFMQYIQKIAIFMQ
jgi:hypothetical protein